MKDIELPSPLGYMNAGHMHELQQGRLHYGYVYPKGGTGAEEAVFTADQLRAVVEADRAQRVPDGFIDWLKKRADDSYSCSLLVKDALALLSAAPAQPAQQTYSAADVAEAHTAGYKLGLSQRDRPAQQPKPSPIKAEHTTVYPSGTRVTRLELTDEAKESLRADVPHIPGQQ